MARYGSAQIQVVNSSFTMAKSPPLSNPKSGTYLKIILTLLCAAFGFVLWTITFDQQDSAQAQVGGQVYGSGSVGRLARWVDPTFNYSLTVSPPSVSINRGSSGIVTVTATLLIPPGQNVTLTASGGPPGTTYAFNNSPCTPTCLNTLTLSIPLAAPLGSYTVTVAGSAPVQTTPFSLQVIPAIPPQCSDGVDNVDPEDTIADFPADPGCTSAADNDERNVTQCSDGIDNDSDGKRDHRSLPTAFPPGSGDPGCTSPGDNSEADPPIIIEPRQ